MTGLSVLFVGGSGTISSACSWLAVEQGIDLFVLNRGCSTLRPLPEQATVLRGDVRDPASVRNAVGDRSFDAVVDWIAFTPEHVRADIDFFRGRTTQYVFISSASAYQTPPARQPVLESTPLRNPFWQYSRDKIACEETLVAAYRDEGFPATIVRPSHTYDRTLVPFDGGWTVLGRMRQGKPVVVHGDGTSLWTLTHHRDFARGFVPLLGHPRTIGEVFHITSDDVLTWNQIAETLAAAAAAPTRNGGPGCSGTRRTRWCSTTRSCEASCRATGRRSPSSRARARSWRGTTRTLRGRWSMPASTPSWTGWPRPTGDRRRCAGPGGTSPRTVHGVPGEGVDRTFGPGQAGGERR